MSFRLLHTADWHLGRLFFNLSLLDDQAHALEQVIAIARDTRADALVLAGDVYDRAVPPADAVRLLDETLRRLALGLDLTVVVIAGNHDSAERLGFGSALMERQRCFIRGPITAGHAPIALPHADGAVRIHPIPYAEPALVRERVGAPDAHTHDAALAALMARIRPGPRDIAVAHCFVTGGAVGESERPLSVGGSGEVAAAHFAGFAYTALGHLHRPQQIGERVHYAGSLLKYAFAEAGQTKSVNLVELDAAGGVRVERIPLTPRRDLRVIEGSLAELLAGPAPGESAADYLLARLSDDGALLDPYGRLKQVYPNLLHLERVRRAVDGPAAGAGREHLKRSEEALFAGFFEQVTATPLDADGSALLADVVESLRRQRREAGA